MSDPAPMDTTAPDTAPDAAAAETAPDAADSRAQVDGTPAFRRCLEAVRLNDTCFASWSLLVAEAERSRNPLLGDVYERLLATFPPLYGYWAKAARHCDQVGAALAIFERGVEATKHASVDLWAKYAAYAVEKNGQGDIDPAACRAILDRAQGACKYDPRSPLVNDLVVAYETDPARQLATARVAIASARATDAAECGFSGRDEALEQLTALAEAAPVSACKDADTFLCEVAEQSNKAAAEDRKRAPFERRIRRPYFHSKPLDEDQLRTWRAYLDWEEDAGDQERTKHLYERCLVACCSYPEFWCRYASYVSPSSSENAVAVLDRGLQFLKHAPDLLLLKAALLEAKGDVDGARLVHESLTDGAPGLLEAVLAHARFERRCGSREDVLAIYKGALPRLDAGSDARGLVQAALARFQLHVLRDADAARQTLEASIREAPQCRELWVAYYALEASSEDAAAPKRVSALFSAALDDSTQLPAASQKALWSLYLQHVEDLGPEIGHLLEVREAHAGWLRKTGQLA